MDADDIECQMHHEFRSCLEHACAPECRADGKTPFGGTETRSNLYRARRGDARNARKPFHAVGWGSKWLATHRGPCNPRSNHGLAQRPHVEQNSRAVLEQLSLPRFSL